MEHGQSGKQDDGWNPEMDIGEDRCPHTGGLRRGVFFSHKFASVLIAKSGCNLRCVSALSRVLLITD
jgi:hypothetical protein